MDAQIERIEQYLDQIITMCREDPTALQMAVANFKFLLDVMKVYERAPRMFTARLGETQLPPRHPGRPEPPVATSPTDQHRFPVIGNLEVEFGRKLKQRDLVSIAKRLTLSLGLKLERQVKRKKDDLLQWFDSNWQAIEPLVREMQWRETVQFHRDP
jgi:hypothetical protein